MSGYLGMKEYEFYTAVFGVSRALGVLANGVWARIFGLPIERPNSIDMAFIEKLGQAEKKEWLQMFIMITQTLLLLNQNRGFILLVIRVNTIWLISWV